MAALGSPQAPGECRPRSHSWRRRLRMARPSEPAESPCLSMTATCSRFAFTMGIDHLPVRSITRLKSLTAVQKFLMSTSLPSSRHLEKHAAFETRGCGSCFSSASVSTGSASPVESISSTRSASMLPSMTEPPSRGLRSMGSMNSTVSKDRSFCASSTSSSPPGGLQAFSSCSIHLSAHQGSVTRHVNAKSWPWGQPRGACSRHSVSESLSTL
mmetsp:Transcript_73541/g.192899  ORF Transcript_73541/g.192899 Transcript_73541/m.192899 type:complete len:213 (-) Transcript_73541:550-1188(-)